MTRVIMHPSEAAGEQSKARLQQLLEGEFYSLLPTTLSSLPQEQPEEEEEEVREERTHW